MDETNRKKSYTPLQAKAKAESYCAYQERSQQEVRDKLYDWGLSSYDVEDVIAELIAENFLNEERFALAYAQGKLRLKGWGKIKIKHHLKGKQVSEPLIKKALQSLDEEEYNTILDTLIRKKITGDLDKLTWTEKNKLTQYLYAKGFERTLIYTRLAGDDA